MDKEQSNVSVLRKFMKEYLDLRKDKDNELLTVESIRKGVTFKGANLWILIFATFMASLGLNVNSTAVIIGAMLISPLMGPIMGIGLAVGINDFELMKRSAKSYLIATVFSVVTSTVFFLISPLSEAQSELLARTSPNIYDVLIALFGGLAGVVALSTKEKGNVIPGVAIATALMPPLCTAGYGIATGNLAFFLGAFYLYFINTVFIALATFLGVRVMHFRVKDFVDKSRELKVRKYIILIVILTMIPAFYLTIGIIQETVFRGAANRFISEEIDFENTQIIDRFINYGKAKDDREIRLVLVGEELPSSSIAMIAAKMDKYNLEGTKLNIIQGAKGDIPDVKSLKAMVLEDFYKESQIKLKKQQEELDSLHTMIGGYKLYEDLSGLSHEISVLYPSVQSVSVGESNNFKIASKNREAITWVIITTSEPISKADEAQITKWLEARLKKENVKLIITK